MRQNSAGMKLALCVLFIGGLQTSHADPRVDTSCIPGQGNCHQHATCEESELYGGYICVCNDGFSGNGVTTCLGR